MPRMDEVIAHLRPGAEWVMYNDSIDELTFTDENVKPISQAEYDQCVKDLEKKKQDEMTSELAAKSALFERLGITADEAALLIK